MGVWLPGTLNFGLKYTKIFKEGLIKRYWVIMAKIRRMVLDVLKPHHPNVIEYAYVLGDIVGVDGANLSVDEIDQETETVKITLEGENISFEAVEETIQKLGGSVHSIDLVATGRRLVEDVDTLMD